MVLAGEADTSDCARLTDELVRRLCPGVTRLAVDVAGLAFADPAAISALAFAARVLRARRGTLVLLHPGTRLRQVLDMTGAGTFMQYEPP